MSKDYNPKGHNAEILLVGTDGELILQQRDDKPGITNPGMITTFGGGVEEGETPLDAAHRELGEETSLKIEKNRFVHYGDYKKTREKHGEDWEVSFFVVKNVDYEGMKVHEGQGYVVVKDVEDIKNYKTSTLFKEVANDWFTGWRDFIFMPEPNEDIINEVYLNSVEGLEDLVPEDNPVLFCPVGVVGAGKTSTVKKVIPEEIEYFTIRSDRIRTEVYKKGYNFRRSSAVVFDRAVKAAIEKRVNILLDTNSSSKADLIRGAENAGYRIVVSYINPREEYVLNKLNNLAFEDCPERFTFFKTPNHVLRSHLQNLDNQLDSMTTFFEEYPPRFTIDPENVTTEEITRMREQLKDGIIV